MIRAKWLPVALCWRIFFGDAIISVGGCANWQTRDELKRHLSSCGLRLEKDNTIQVESPVVR